MATLTDLFIGDPKWDRPTPGANRCVVEAGCNGCICVPNSATRVVVEMWGQGGGGAGARCCTWGRTGGQGGSYAAKVWEGDDAPAVTGCCIMFCGCVCACDCRANACSGCCGHPGQFSRLTSCSTGNPTVGSWIGCVNGGAGGCRLCTASSWVCCGEQYDCNRQYDTCCINTNTIGLPEYYSICCMSTAQSSSCNGGSRVCCDGASCYCAANYCSATCSGDPHCYSNNVVTCASNSGSCGFDTVFVPVNCSCFDVYRLGACGFTVNSNLGYNSTWNYCHVGNGGAAYGGGAQQLRNFSNGNFAYCGFAGNFPGGGGKTSGACGGGCCCGSIGGAGVILVSWDT